MLILKALQHAPRHGLAIADRIQQMSQDILRVEQGSLYPALYRLEAQGWIKAEWGVSDNNRQGALLQIDHGRAQAIGSGTGALVAGSRRESIWSFLELEFYATISCLVLPIMLGLFRRKSRRSRNGRRASTASLTD